MIEDGELFQVDEDMSLNLTDFNIKEFSEGFFSEWFNKDDDDNNNCLLPSSRSPSPSSCVEDALPPPLLSSEESGGESSWIQQIENMLFNEDCFVQENPPQATLVEEDDFFADLQFPQVQEGDAPQEQEIRVSVDEEDDLFSDIFIDVPVDEDDNRAELVVSNAEISTPEFQESQESQMDNDKTDISSDDKEEEPCLKKRSYTSEEKVNENDDPITKKRKRQMRNRDAAVQSRERKKMYVKDLELKSKYLEGECIRLQRLLQYCSAENQALHFQLQEKAYAASRTKQESAVLLLESLLLGSLLWFLSMLGLFSPLEMRLQLPASAPESVDSSHPKVVDLVAQGRAKSKSIGLGALRLFFKNKRCKSSRSRMRVLNCDGAVVSAC